jgi:hypothetical protein
MPLPVLTVYRDQDIFVDGNGAFFTDAKSERLQDPTMEGLKKKIDRSLKKTFTAQDVYTEKSGWRTEEGTDYEIIGKATSQRSDGQLVIRLRTGGNSHQHPKTCYPKTAQNLKTFAAIKTLGRQIKALEKKSEDLKERLTTMKDVIGKQEDDE